MSLKMYENIRKQTKMLKENMKDNVPTSKKIEQLEARFDNIEKNVIDVLQKNMDQIIELLKNSGTNISMNSTPTQNIEKSKITVSNSKEFIPSIDTDNLKSNVNKSVKKTIKQNISEKLEKLQSITEL